MTLGQLLENLSFWDSGRHVSTEPAQRWLGIEPACGPRWLARYICSETHVRYVMRERTMTRVSFGDDVLGGRACLAGAPQKRRQRRRRTTCNLLNVHGTESEIRQIHVCRGAEADTPRLCSAAWQRGVEDKTTTQARLDNAALKRSVRGPYLGPAGHNPGNSSRRPYPGPAGLNPGNSGKKAKLRRLLLLVGTNRE